MVKIVVTGEIREQQYRLEAEANDPAELAKEIQKLLSLMLPVYLVTDGTYPGGKAPDEV